MARYQVRGIVVGDAPQGGVAQYAVTLQPDGGTPAQSLRVTGPPGSVIASMKYGDFFSLNQQNGRYRVSGFAAVEVQQADGSIAPAYSATLFPTAAGATADQVVTVIGPAGSQVATEAMIYGRQFDFLAS